MVAVIAEHTGRSALSGAENADFPRRAGGQHAVQETTRELIMPDPSNGAPPPDEAPIEVPEPPTETPPDLPDVPPPGPENLVTESDERIDIPAYPPPGPEGVVMRGAGPSDLPDQPPPGPVNHVSDEHHGMDSEPSADWHFDGDV